MSTPDDSPADLPAAYAELGRLHADLAALRSELAVSRHETAVLRAGRPVRATVAWRQLRRASGARARLRALRALVRELRRSLPRPPAPQPIPTSWPLLDATSPLDDLRALTQLRPHDLDLRRALRDALSAAARADADLLDEAIAAAEAVRAGGGGLRDRVLLERLTGARRVLAPGWQPRIAAPLQPPVPEPRCVLHVLPDFGPGAPGRWASWPGPADDLRGGRLPVVLTPLPERPPTGALEVVSGIPHEVLDLGPAYPYDGPADLVHDDLAWASLQVALPHRPAVVRAVWAPDRHELAALGGALARALGARLILDAVDASGPVGALREQAARAVLELADEVVAHDGDAATGARAAAAGTGG